jgi:hypothetical protein
VSNDVRIQVHWSDDDGGKFAKATKDKAKRVGEQAGTEFEGTFKGKLGPAGEKAGQAAGEGLEKGLRDGARKGGKGVDDEVGRVASRANKAFDVKAFSGLSLGLPAAAAVGVAGAGVALAAVPLLFAGLGVAALKGNAQVADSFGSLKDHVVGDTQAMAGVLAGPVSESTLQLGASFDRLRPQIQSAMAGSSAAVHELTGTVTDFAENAMPGMVTAVKSSEPALKGLHSFSEQTGKGMSDFFTNMSAGSAGAGQGLNVLGGTVSKLEGRLGTLFANLANGSSGPLRSLDVIVDQVSGSLVDLTSKGSGAMGALQGFSTAGSGLVTVLRGVSSVVSALPTGVTQLAGSIGAASMIASKFGVDAGKGFEGLGTKVKAATGFTSKLGTTVTGLAEGALNPAALAVGALGAGLMILGHNQEIAAKYTAEHEAGVQRLTSAIRADNGVLGEHVRQANLDALTTKNAASNLAVFGENMGDAKLAIEGNTDAYDRLNYSARARLAVIAQNAQLDATDTEALKGLGTEALKTGKNYEQLTAAGGRGAQVAQMLGGAWNDQINSILNANGAVGEQINQQKVAYETYLASEGALNNLSDAQVRNRDATAEATQEMYNQQNAGLGLRGATLNTKQALEEYDKTLKDGKASADDKAASLLRVEQAFAAEEEAARKAGEANSTSATDSGKAADGFAAMNAKTVELANSLNGALPASLATTISKMDVTQAKAAGLTVAVDGTGNAVYRLPNGKEIRISADTGQAQAAIAEVVRMQNALHNKEVTNTIINRVVNLSTSGGAYQPSLSGRRAYGAAGGLIKALPTKALAMGGLTGGSAMLDITAGGLLRGPGTGTSDGILGLSSSGPVDTSNGEFVINARQTRKHLPLLQAINDGRDGLAGGGLTGPVKYGDVSQSAWDGLYASGWRGNPNDGMEALYAPAQRQAAAAGARSASAPVQVHLTFDAPRDEFGQVIVEYLRRYVRVSGGGNVQATLGQR